jgi:threonylcarbamoyladenosine tRNA methylthiotransferase MtaB
MRVFLRTFGCRANQYDSEQVRSCIEASGGEVVDDPADADAAVFNSCAVTTEAEVELRKGIRRAARRNGGLRTVVMGCAAALDRGDLRRLPTVTAVVSGGDVDSVAESLGLARPAARASTQDGTRALLRIQDGCDEHCTFCATTQARGRNRSRPAGEIVREACQLAERHPEIVLTGIHIGTWGRDLGTTLGSLVATLVRDVSGVRFRLTSVEASEVDGELAELFGEPARLAPHLHAPLQSGSDRLLRRMGRHWYTSGSYARAVERIVAGRTVFALGADVIAGFPGESEADHQATLSLVQRLPFSYLHVFPYSARPGTAATRLPDPVDAQVARRRAAELRQAGVAAARRYEAGRVGGSADVIVVRGERREGLTEDYLVVDAPPLPRGSRFTGILCQGPTRLVADQT